MTIHKEQWDEIDKIFPKDGTDWDGVSEPTVLVILQLIKTIEDVRIAMRQYNADFDAIKFMEKLKDSVGNQN